MRLKQKSEHFLMYILYIKKILRILSERYNFFKKALGDWWSRGRLGGDAGGPGSIPAVRELDPGGEALRPRHSQQ